VSGASRSASSRSGSLGPDRQEARPDASGGSSRDALTISRGREVIRVAAKKKAAKKKTSKKKK
jgi:hypothetical protein